MKKILLNMFSVLSVQYPGGGIGNKDTLIWSGRDLPGDMPRFIELTMDSVTVMGRDTWNSLWKRPLTGRINVVITSNPDRLEDVEGVDYVAKGLNDAIQWIQTNYPDKKISIIGGGMLYYEALPMCARCYVTEIYPDKERMRAADTFVVIPPEFMELASETKEMVNKDGIPYFFKILVQKGHNPEITDGDGS